MRYQAIRLGVIAAMTVLVTACGQAQSGVGLSNIFASAAGKKESPAPKRVTVRPFADSYYDAADGLSGRALLMALNRIVARHTDVGYDQARDFMFGAVDDLDNDDVVRCVYIGRALEKVSNRSSAYRNGDGLNAEHTWPQSLGAEGTARSDLHHLFPADIRTNGLRGSLPFGEVKKVEWTGGGSVLGLDGWGKRVFQPRAEQKGNTARALLYFYTVYGASAALNVTNFKVEEDVIKRWHVEDPVNAEEQARNAMVYNVQGNRNPYIDHPEFVARVGTFRTQANERIRPR
jgi:deoxyribonuclease-1